MRRWNGRFPVIVLGATLTACGGGGSSSGGSNGGGADLGANAMVLPAMPGLEMVTHIEPRDLDGDGRQDLIMLVAPPSYGAGARLQAVMNRVEGFEIDNQYFPASLFAGNERWLESAVQVDLDGDGALDIVAHLDLQSSPVAVLMWDAAAQQFSKPAEAENAFTSGLTGYVAIDADADGDVDLLARDEQQRWYLLSNDGDGRFTRSTTPLFTAQSNAYFVYHPVVLDVDGDGRDDLIFGGPRYLGGWVDQAEPLVVMMNGVAGWTQADNSAVFTGDAPEFTHLRLTRTADFNNDGHVDVVIVNHGYDAGGMSGEYNGLLLNTGNGSFVVNTTSAPFNYRGFTHALAVGDLDQDGDVDIVFVDITGADVDYRSKIRLLYNDGNGQFSTRIARLSHDYAMTAGSWTAAALTDLDGDGYPDLVLGAMSGEGSSIVLYNDGRGYFR